MKDHNPSCETRIFPGSRNCTCGALDENYSAKTEAGVVDAEPAAPSARQPLSREAIIDLLRSKHENYAMQDNVDASKIAKVLKGILTDIGG